MSGLCDGRYLYLFGGLDYDTITLDQSIFDTIHRYDASSDSWSVLDAKLPQPMLVNF